MDLATTAVRFGECLHLFQGAEPARRTRQSHPPRPSAWLICGACLAAPRDQQGFHRAIRLLLDPAQLLGPVPYSSAIALDQQDRHPHEGDAVVDAPGAERRVQPGAVPSPERVVHVPVVAGEAGAQVRRFVGVARLGDAGDRDRSSTITCGAISTSPAMRKSCVPAGVQQRDGGTVRVAHQHGAADAGTASSTAGSTSRASSCM